MNWNDFRLRLRALFTRRRVERDLEDELQFHIAMQARKNLNAGMSAQNAVPRAHAEFGGFQQVKEECRDARRLYWIDTLLKDVRYALRGFRRTPGFALTVVATIALGLGLNTTIFTIFNAYVLRPLAVRDPYSLYQFTWTTRNGGGHLFTWQEFQDFREKAPAFSDVLGFHPLLTRAAGHEVYGHLVTGNYFHMVGVAAAAGRTLLPEDAATPVGAPVVVLSSTAWKNKFGGDPDIIGTKLIVHGYPLQVVGIAQAGFNGLGPIPLDFWAPLTLDPHLMEGPNLFGPEHPERIRIVGRLRHDVNPRQAAAALKTWARQETVDRPDAEKATAAALRSEATTITLEPALLAAFSPIFVAFGLVLLIACANVANMMLARSLARQREIGIRLAMGAARSRLIRQLLTESMLLALPAAAAGFGVSYATIAWCQRLLFATLPRGYLEFVTFIPLQPDARVFAFMLAAAVFSALLFGLAPAIQATRSSITQATRGEFTTDFRPSRLRNVLVIGQVTVSVLMLICAAALLRANSRLQKLDTGLNVRGVVEIELQDKFRSKVNRQLVSEPMVQLVAAGSKTPLFGYLPWVPVAPDDRPEHIPVRYIYVSPEYFPLFQVPILRGRSFTAEEAKGGAPLAVISQKTAQQLWPGRDALGRSFRIAPRPPRRDLSEYRAGPPAYAVVRVIGIARDAVNGWIVDGTDRNCIYLPSTAQTAGNVLFVRVNDDAGVARAKLDTALTASIPGAVDQIHTMDDILAGQIYPFRAIYWVTSAIGGLALLLTLSGIYGVLSYLVTQRTKEIGIRVALGASTGRVVGLVLKQSLKLAATGAVMGAIAAAVAIPILASQMDLSISDSVDGVVFVMSPLLVIAASAGAAWVPSRCAARIEPITTLRCD